MGKVLKVFSPYDNHLIRELELNDEESCLKMLQTSYRLSQNLDLALPHHERIEILERTADMVDLRKEDFARQSAEEGGKPLIDSREELKRAVQGIREAARSIPQIVGKEIPMGITASSSNRKAFTIREPIGTVLAISAFNHPFNLIVHQVIPAVAVGCPVIIKPARTTPISCLNLVNTLHESGLPKIWCQTAICSGQTAEKLAIDPRTSFVSLIGSPTVGWNLRSKLAPGTRCALEHGGTAPVIIEKDADLKDAIPLLAKGGFYHAGQVCVSVQRIYIHKDIADVFLQQFVNIAENLVVGDPLDENTEIGPLISKEEVERVDKWIQEAVSKGGKILTGGKKVGETCYKPTVLLNPPDNVTISCNEVFGPVVNVYLFHDRQEALKRANNTRFSFQAAVFTKNLDVAWDTAKKLNAAAVMINDHTAFRVDWMPFAGYKESGLGIGGILPSMEEMTEEKLLVFRSPSL